MGRLAVVTPWFGRDLTGGAERLAWEIATRLARRHEVEVLTTCSSAFSRPWDCNDLPAGANEESGVTVRRFPVARRDGRAFDIANRELLSANGDVRRPGVSPVSAAAAHYFVRENIRSPELRRDLERRSHSFGAVLFLPYLYGTTLDGLPAAGDRACLLPLLHDEAYAYLPAIAQLLLRPRRLLFLSAGERDLAARLAGPAAWAKGELVGAGVSPLPPGEPVEGLAAGDFLLCLGRRDPTKNTPRLIDAYRRLRRARTFAPALVLAGPGRIDARRDEGIVDLGVVSEAERAWLLDHCRALVQPSCHESFSLVVHEAWLAGRPVVVHGACAAMADAVRECGGGWTVNTDEEWPTVLASVVDASASELAEVGARGCTRATESCDWDAVLQRYERALGLAVGHRERRSVPLMAVHQVVPALAFGDAISNQSLALRDQLRDQGFRSKVFAHHFHPAMERYGEAFTPARMRPEDAIVYHHSIGCPLLQQVAEHRGPKALVYHNITPQRFFAEWDPALAGLVEQGRKELAVAAGAFALSFADSEFNAAELLQAGFVDPGLLPIVVDPGRWDFPPDPAWMARLQDGWRNVLFVGRLAPNKCQHDLVAAFDCLRRIEPGTRLVLVGHQQLTSYGQFVAAEVERRGLGRRVLVLGEVGESVLAACYRTADVFVCLSEHEGFGVPLVEAMWFDVPVVAFRAAAVPETLGDAGVLLTRKEPEHVAIAVQRLLRDEAARAAVLARQRERRECFRAAVVGEHLRGLVSKLTAEAGNR